jgi:hypothetical protein
MRRQVIVAVMAVIGAAGCIQNGSGGGIFNPGPQYASGQQIFNSLTNFSVVGALANGQAYCEYHAPNGGLMGRTTQPYTGSWQVNGNQICYNSPQSGQYNNCLNVAFEGQRASFYTTGGEPVASGNMIGGNVC